MDADVFTKLLTIIENDIRRQDTNMRGSIKPRDRLALTLRFPATGETFQSLAYATRIAPNTLSQIIPDTLQAILNNLEVTCVKVPTSASEWKIIAHSFNVSWLSPHCIPAIDGKKVTFRAPRSEGANFRDYKGNNSIVLLTIVDAHYKYVYVNIGANGRVNDGAIFNNSKLAEALNNKKLNLPAPEEIECFSGVELPYVFVADVAFALKEYMMKWYPERDLSEEKRVFNYRLSRARRVVENAFSTMSNKFGVLLSPIRLSAKKVDIVIRVCCVLHNFILEQKSQCYIPPEIGNRTFASTMEGIQQQNGRNPTVNALRIRDQFRNYFNTVGSVPWQQQCVDAGRW
ncbi:protein ALP1-like [Schistocerca piceifrons]|uniref:protein ALP1-like n=1 Tax=Schistocerca piceifrons TaxID=274613 RepID=UPI001F5EDAC1|nr:protein ALP1-like [Schistocerca piceifrons]